MLPDGEGTGPLLEVNLDGLKPPDALALLLELYVSHVGTYTKTELALEDVLGGVLSRRAAARWDASRRLSIPKDTPARSERYLAYVRTLPCCCCETDPPNDPHHVGGRGMGTKEHDYCAVPLCRRCHDEIHAGRDPRPERLQTVTLAHWFRHQIARCLVVYVRTLEGV